MTVKISYNTSTGKTAVDKDSSVILEADYQKMALVKQWLFYNEHKNIICSLRLNSKIFSRKARISALLMAEDLESKIDINFCWQWFFTYLISAENADGKYLVYPHMQDKFSIFLDNKQIASLVRISEYKSFTSDFTWLLNTNDNVDLPVLILISYACFILGDKGLYKNSDYSLGNNYWIKEAKRFDTNWRPLN